MKRGMPSGAQTPDGIISLLALIFSKAPPRYPPPHGAHWAYTRQTLIPTLGGDFPYQYLYEFSLALGSF